jgi:flagellar hook protein FlgE
VSGGVLESSNTDLGTEFSEMIITQRAFQANARTITAADTLLQEAVNLVR